MPRFYTALRTKGKARCNVCKHTRRSHVRPCAVGTGKTGKLANLSRARPNLAEPRHSNTASFPASETHLSKFSLHDSFMLSRFRNFRRCTHASPKQPLPHVAWLPPELIIRIWTFLSPHSTSNTSLADLARVCRGWHGAAMACIYECVAPASLISCKLLIRSLKKNPHLSGLIKSLIFPYDYQLLSPQAPNVKHPAVMQKLVARCTSLRDLQIPMFCAVTWTDDLLKANLPHMATLENIQNLTILGFDINPPFSPRAIPAQYVSMWLCQAPSLPRLETMTLRVAFSLGSADRPCPWPSMPRLRHLQFYNPIWSPRPWSPGPETLLLLPSVRESLKSLHITGGRVHPGSLPSISECCPNLRLSTLEELVLTYFNPCEPKNLDPWWFHEGLEHMVSLRHLHISKWMFHDNILLRPPPLLAALTITMDCRDRSTPGRLHLRDLFRLPPPTVKTDHKDTRIHVGE